MYKMLFQNYRAISLVWWNRNLLDVMNMEFPDEFSPFVTITVADSCRLSVSDPL